MKKETPKISNQLDFTFDSSRMIKLSDKASRRMLYLLNNPPEPSEFLKRAMINYKNNIKNT